MSHSQPTTPAAEQPVVDNSAPVKVGVLKKRSARLHQWNTRYFTLQGSKLSYKLKPDAANPRDTFDLIPGCIVTQVTECKSSISGKKLYSFWIVWPKSEDEAANPPAKGDDSDDEKETVKDAPAGEDDLKSSKTRKLQQIAEQEALHLKQQKSHTEKQLEQLEARDGGISLGTKVAAVAVGGVVVGALSAGIGVGPYMTVVGMTLAASGGAVAWQLRKPADDRLILACESMEEAIEWKTAVEGQIHLLEEAVRPSPASNVDRKVISSIIDKTSNEGVWRRVAVVEGLRILEHAVIQPTSIPNPPLFDWSTIKSTYSSNATDTVLNHAVLNEFKALYSARNCKITTRCRRSQSVIKAPPMSCLLMIMESSKWPKNGSVKVAKEIDDHADVIEVETITDCRPYGGKEKSVYRKLCLNRFWRLDDDGVYLITLNTTFMEDNPPGVKTNEKSAYVYDKKATYPSIDAVITIAPRFDVSNHDFDIPEALVTISCQISLEGNWKTGESVAFMDNFLLDHLLGLKFNIVCQKYDVYECNLAFSASVDPMPVAYPTSAKETSERPTGLLKHSQTIGPGDLQRQTSLGRRGVQTVQPGMEDFNNNPSSSSAAMEPIAEEHDDPASSPVHKKRSMLGFLSRHRKKDKDKEGSVTAADTHSIATEKPSRPQLFRSQSDTMANFDRSKGNSGIHYSPQTSPTQATRKGIPDGRDSLASVNSTMTNNNYNNNNNYKDSHYTPVKGDAPLNNNKNKKTDKVKNSEASLLRQQIATTEYELQRLSKNIRKKVITTNIPVGSKPDKHAVTPVEYNLLQEQQSELQQKLQNLRREHVHLTGVTYEQAKASRSTLSRLRSLGSSGRKGLPAQSYSLDQPNELGTIPEAIAEPLKSLSAQSSPSKDHIKSFMMKDPNKYSRPLHWLTYEKKTNKKGWISYFFRIPLTRQLWSIIIRALINNEEDIIAWEAIAGSSSSSSSSSSSLGSSSSAGVVTSSSSVSAVSSGATTPSTSSLLSSDFDPFDTDDSYFNANRLNAIPLNQIGSFVAIVIFIAFFVLTQFLHTHIWNNYDFLEWIEQLSNRFQSTPI